MSDVHYKKHRVFRETEDVIFYDISVEESNASDLVVHTGPATSPPDDSVGAKQFYIHSFQDDYNRVVSGERMDQSSSIRLKDMMDLILMQSSIQFHVQPILTYIMRW